MMRIRYKTVKQTVNNLFIKLSINTYPIDILKVCSSISNCRVIPYSKHMERHDLTIDEIMDHFGSDEGCTFYSFNKKRYLIFYNDLNIRYKTPRRRRWTIAHELGHVFLSHHTISNKTILFRNKLTDEEYEWMEAEANRFASLLLANPIILHKLNIKDNADIMQICQLSEEASRYRYQDYLKWKKYKYHNKQDLIVLLQFHDFIYKKKCLNCNYGFVSKDATYCPICGQKLIWGDGKMKYKEGVQLDNEGKALICPNCSNEDIDKFDIYCKICGIYLYQRCDGLTNYDINGDEYYIEEPCEIKLDSNARYCTQCGGKTTFYKSGCLSDWTDEKKQIKYDQHKDEAAASIDIDNEDIPF